MSDLFALLSSIRGDFISDYISMIDSTDVMFLENMLKYVNVKLETVHTMLRRERLTLWQCKNKRDFLQQDVVRRVYLKYLEFRFTYD
jgi:hypothetical protein